MRVNPLFPLVFLSPSLIQGLPVSPAGETDISEEAFGPFARSDEFGDRECFRPGVNMDKFPKNCERLGHEGCYWATNCRDKRSTGSEEGAQAGKSEGSEARSAVLPPNKKVECYDRCPDNPVDCFTKGCIKPGTTLGDADFVDAGDERAEKEESLERRREDPPPGQRLMRCAGFCALHPAQCYEAGCFTNGSYLKDHVFVDRSFMETMEKRDDGVVLGGPPPAAAAPVEEDEDEEELERRQLRRLRKVHCQEPCEQDWDLCFELGCAADGPFGPEMFKNILMTGGRVPPALE